MGEAGFVVQTQSLYHLYDKKLNGFTIKVGHLHHVGLSGQGDGPEARQHLHLLDACFTTYQQKPAQ